MLISKCRQEIGYLRRNKTCARTRTLICVTDYGDVIYKPAPASTLKPLDSLYRSALRFITGDPSKTHHCRLDEKLNWSYLAALREKHRFIFIRKGHMPAYITYLLCFNKKNYQTLSSDQITCQTRGVFYWQNLLLAPGQ